MKTKKFTLQPIKMTMETNGFPCGLVLKRDLTSRECRHILYHYLGINIMSREECDDTEEYESQNEEYTTTVNQWLRGDVDDDAIMEFAFDCSDDPIGIFNIIPIIAYLQEKEII